MDTKLKKFSRSKLTKAAAFLLALVFFTAAALSGFNLILSAFQDAEKRDIISSYLSSGAYQLTRGEKFKNALTKYCEAAVGTKLIYKSGSEKDYETYKASVAELKEQVLKEMKESIQNSISTEGGTADFSSLFDYIESKTVTLKRLGDHNCYLEKGVTLFQSGSAESYVTDNRGNVYEYYTDYLDDTPSGDYDEYLMNTTMPSTMPYPKSTAESVTHPVTGPHYDEDSRVFTKTSIPASIKKKAVNPENIVEICSVQHINTKEKYDGYYEFFIDESKIDTDNMSDAVGEYCPLDPVKNYTDFSQKAQRYKTDFSRFFHASVIIMDEANGRVVFSNAEDFNTTDRSAEEAKFAIDSAPFGFSYLLASGNSVTFGNHTSNAMTKNNIYDVCTALGNSFYCYSGRYRIYVMTDSFFTDKELAASISDSSDPFEGILADSLEAQKEVHAELLKTVFFLVLFLVFAVYLVLVAGKVPEDNEVHPAAGDGIFTLLRTVIDLGIIAGIVVGAIIWGGYCVDTINNASHSANPAFYYGVFALCAAACCAFLLDWVLYLARHIKSHTLFKNLLLVQLIGKLSERIKKQREKRRTQPAAYKDILKDVLKKLSIFVLLPNIIVGLPCVFAVSNDSFGGWFFGIILAIYDFAALLYAAYYAFCVRKVFFTLDEMRKGNHTQSIDTAKMPAAVKIAAVDAMHLGEGLHAAVESAVREEKMKAELITNVSHDLKTPLTSIINYTDLLSRCEITDETAKGYITVLKEKSERLKKLIEDLVEASKASSGAIKVELMKVSLTELALQLEGEYADEFEARGLELVCEGMENEIFVLADGKLCHRVLDNLMGNVKKYAMKNTRVYLTLKKSANAATASITLKNISEGKLNISPEELKARFVRGDASRTSEGNGLGLSIADNLCTLQGGKLDIEIIGDLFCATATFKTAE